MSCSAAPHVAARAYSLRGLRPIFGPQFGAGGFGGPFRVGEFHCYLLARGSDFRDARCRQGAKSLRFFDHRDYTQVRGQEPGWSGPLQNP